jgi:hypothetical protein
MVAPSRRQPSRLAPVNILGALRPFRSEYLLANFTAPERLIGGIAVDTTRPLPGMPESWSALGFELHPEVGGTEQWHRS